MSSYSDPEAVKRWLRINYLSARSDQSAKLVDGISGLVARLQARPFVIQGLIQEAADYIHRQFRLRWVMMGLRSPSDGKYRYEAMAGLRADAWEKQKTRVYSREDFNPVVPGFYKAGEISKLTKVYLEEENPLGEEDKVKVNRPLLLNSKRKSQWDALEADYLDTLIMGTDGDMLGWIDYSGTITGKYPDAITIRWIELTAALLAAGICCQESRVAFA